MQPYKQNARNKIGLQGLRVSRGHDSKGNERRGERSLLLTLHGERRVKGPVPLKRRASVPRGNRDWEGVHVPGGSKETIQSGESDVLFLNITQLSGAIATSVATRHAP